MFIVAPEDRDCFGKNTKGRMRGDLQKSKTCSLSTLPKPSTTEKHINAMFPSSPLPYVSKILEHGFRQALKTGRKYSKAQDLSSCLKI